MLIEDRRKEEERRVREMEQQIVRLRGSGGAHDLAKVVVEMQMQAVDALAEQARILVTSPLLSGIVFEEVKLLGGFTGVRPAQRIVGFPIAQEG